MTYKEFLNKSKNNFDISVEDNDLLQEVIKTCLNNKLVTEDQLNEMKKGKDIFGGIVKSVATILQRKLISIHNKIISTSNLSTKLDLISVKQNIQSSLTLLSISMQSSNKSLLSKIGVLSSIKTS
jgi:hypothetical protein